jgi:hypothetical protein
VSLLVRCLRVYFGLAAILTLARAVLCFMVLGSLALMQRLADYDPGYLMDLYQRGPLMAAVSLLSFIGWLQLRRRGVNAQKWALGASLANLAWFPVGTVAGIAGLVVFSLADSRHILAEPKSKPRFQPLAGDGTTRFSPMAFVFTGWGLSWAGYQFLNRWAFNSGLQEQMDHVPFLASVAMAVALSTAFHEFGHILGVWACEFSLSRVRLGPFHWSNELGRKQLRINLRQCFGGSVTALPTKPDGLRARHLFILAAGPAGSLLFGSLSLLLFLTARNQPWQPFWLLLEILAVFCLSDAVCNLMPLGTRDGSYSDGARLWQLARGGEWARHIEFALFRGLSITSDHSPADWPSQEVEASAQFAPTTPAKTVEHFLAYTHYRLRGELPQAFQHMRELVALSEHADDHLLTVIAPEVGFHYAWYEVDTARARQWLEQPGQHDADHNRVLCAILAQEGDLDGARKAWQTGWPLLLQTPFNGSRQLDERDYALMAQRWFPDLAHLPAAIRPTAPALPAPAVPAESCVGA